MVKPRGGTARVNAEVCFEVTEHFMRVGASPAGKRGYPRYGACDLPYLDIFQSYGNTPKFSPNPLFFSPTHLPILRTEGK
jgi:hypothetical protein